MLRRGVAAVSVGAVGAGAVEEERVLRFLGEGELGAEAAVLDSLFCAREGRVWVRASRSLLGRWRQVRAWDGKGPCTPATPQQQPQAGTPYLGGEGGEEVVAHGGLVDPARARCRGRE